MEHVILGSGNLGLDLHDKLSKRYKVHIFDRGQGSNAELLEIDPDVIWCCIGAGGPGHDLSKQLDAHVVRTLTLAETFKGKRTKLIFFSTHYLNMDPEGKFSTYARTKAMMENTMQQFNNARCIRVGSLYGSHFPLKTLPGKIIATAEGLSVIKGASNIVTPTSTRWLADELVENQIWNQFNELPAMFSYSPAGQTSVSEWIFSIIAERNLYADAPVKCGIEEFTDLNYPHRSGGGSFVGRNWYNVWQDNSTEMVLKSFEALGIKPQTGRNVVRMDQPPTIPKSNE